MDGLYYSIGSETLRSVALKPNEEKMKLEWWISSLEYISKQQNVEDRHTLHRNEIAVSEPMSENIPKEEGYRKQKLVVEGEEEEEIDTDFVTNILDEDYATAYGTPGPSVEAK
ncbi:hypothetical protein L1987_37985 [Smallanthus sonchifolius]|uniref:Uncharacterized protein n=1 Tax=Smallanthus sonchifolius TaxID=185202 RepID=A0ACB9HJ40_9ASTR|nr:hypothetical protein L1987_37985 [Smallanthus sonchifolius]